MIKIIYHTFKMVNINNDRIEDILFRARKISHYNNLLITQCDSWLSEEEGMRNMEKRIRERTKKETGIFNRIFKIN